MRIIFLLIILLSPPLLWAQSSSKPNTDNLYHWAYGAAFGTGFYTYGDDRIFTLRVMPSFELKEWESKNLTLNTRLPVTIGVQDTDLRGIGNIDFDSFLKTISFVPGLNLVWFPYEQWRLKPFGHYGWGTQLGGDESARIYFGGINSRYTFDLNPFDMDLLNGIHWMGYNPNRGNTNTFSRLITGLEWAIPLGDTMIGKQQALLRPHIAHFWYFDELGFNQLQSSAVELKQELEVALAVGTQEKMALGFFKFDRIGIAYRTSDNIKGIRIFFGSIMD